MNMRRRLKSLLLTPGSIAPSKVLLHWSGIVVVRYGRRWVIETRSRVVAGNSLLQVAYRLVTCRANVL
jgi:hypothetical protein